MAQVRLNLKGVTSLLLDSDQFSQGLIASMLRGFGMDPPVICRTGAAAMAYLQNHCVDLCIIEAMLPDMSGPELIHWIRRPEMEAARYVPIIVLSSYTQLCMVSDARDAGANIIVRKPLSPQGLFDRITWVARVSRPFIECDSYVGPDRRFKASDPPNRVLKRGTDPREGTEGSAPVPPRSINKLAAAVAKGNVR